MNDNEKMITNLPGFKKAWEDKFQNGAFRALFKFDNSFGASIVRSEVSYGGDKGLFELAVIHWFHDDWNITYTTPITDDVCGYLTVDDVKEKLAAIQALTKDNCYYDWDEDEEVLDNEL